MQNIKRKNGAYSSTTLKLSKKVLTYLDQYQNQSDMIESIMNKEAILWCNKISIRHARKSFPEKRTFTFTAEFKKKLEKTGNMSSAVDTFMSEFIK